eukprot:s240_g18.t1
MVNIFYQSPWTLIFVMQPLNLTSTCLATPGEVGLNPRTFLELNGEEMIFKAEDETEAVILPGTVKCQRHLFQTMDARLTEDLNDLHGYITAELHPGFQGRVAEPLGASSRVFSRWDFDLPSHQRAFLELQEKEVPDEIYMAPTCGPWSVMQSLAARTPEQQQNLRELREWHHSCAFAKRSTSNRFAKVDTLTWSNQHVRNLGRPMHFQICLDFSADSINVSMDVLARMSIWSGNWCKSQLVFRPPRWLFSRSSTNDALVIINTVGLKGAALVLVVEPATISLLWPPHWLPA